MKFLRLTSAVLMALSVNACATSPAPVHLQGTWQLTEIKGKSIQLPEAIILFDAEGNIAATVGCNRIFGTYRLHAPNHISIPPAASTLKACHGELMQTEQLLHHTLANIQNGTFHVQNKTLTIRNQKGTVVLQAQYLPENTKAAP